MYCQNNHVTAAICAILILRFFCPALLSVKKSGLARDDFVGRAALGALDIAHVPPGAVDERLVAGADWAAPLRQGDRESAGARRLQIRADCGQGLPAMTLAKAGARLR